MNWSGIKTKAQQLLADKGSVDPEYAERLKFEIKEIEKQGANGLWEEYVNKGETWDTNPNGLVLPWLLNLTPVDPIQGEAHNVIVSEDGEESEIVVITTDDGSSYELPLSAQIIINDKTINVSDLQNDMII